MTGVGQLGMASSRCPRSGAFDVVQVATHVCSQGGVRHVRIMGGGILCRKALPNLPQQGKRETKLFKQQIVLRSRVKVNVDVEFQVICRQVASSAGDGRMWRMLRLRRYSRQHTAEVIDGVETTTTEFCGDVAGAPRCDDDSTGIIQAAARRR